MANVSDFVIFKLRLARQSVKGWALENGYKPDTVYKTIHGRRGTVRDRGESVRIRAHLKRDGFWPTEDEVASVSNG